MDPQDYRGVDCVAFGFFVFVMKGLFYTRNNGNLLGIRVLISQLMDYLIKQVVN